MSKVTYKPHRQRPGCLFFFVLFIIVGLILAATVRYTNIIPLNLSKETAKFGRDEYPQFEEVWSYGQGSNKVIRITIDGMITLRRNESLFGRDSSSITALKAIQRATLDKDVQAIILDIDSGGGGVTASDIIYKRLLDFKKADPKRKIVAIFGDIAASGAYYISLAADHIIARPTSTTGSIGVLIPSVNFFELASKHGIKDATIKSGENKDLLNPLKAPSEQQQAILQSVVDNLYNRFVSLVVKNRKIPEQDVRNLADGRVFSASEAQALKLIDEIGYWDDAMTRTAELLKKDKIIVYRYKPTVSFSELLMGASSFNPKALLNSSPRAQYRWQ
jgi:protease-4